MESTSKQDRFPSGLRTGQETEDVEGAAHTSCTLEMADTGAKKRNETVSFPSFVLDPTSLHGHGGSMAEKSIHVISCVLSWKTRREFWRKSISCLPRTHFPQQNAGSRYSVGVLDEIQMLGDETRGWAWTRTYGKKRTVSSLCILKAIILPRQARDTRRENSKNESVCFRRAAGPRC